MVSNRWLAMKRGKELMRQKGVVMSSLVPTHVQMSEDMTTLTFTVTEKSIERVDLVCDLEKISNVQYGSHFMGFKDSKLGNRCVFLFAPKLPMILVCTFRGYLTFTFRYNGHTVELVCKDDRNIRNWYLGLQNATTKKDHWVRMGEFMWIKTRRKLDELAKVSCFRCKNWLSLILCSYTLFSNCQHMTSNCCFHVAKLLPCIVLIICLFTLLCWIIILTHFVLQTKKMTRSQIISEALIKGPPDIHKSKTTKKDPLKSISAGMTIPKMPTKIEMPPMPSIEAWCIFI